MQLLKYTVFGFNAFRLTVAME